MLFTECYSVYRPFARFSLIKRETNLEKKRSVEINFSFTISSRSRFHKLHHHQTGARLLLNTQLRELSGDDRGGQSKREVRVRHHAGTAEPDLQVSRNCLVSIRDSPSLKVRRRKNVRQFSAHF